MNNDNDKFFSLVTFGLAFAAWIRTTEAMYLVAPSSYVTFTGVELRWLYAAFNAAWVEFTIIYIIMRFGKVHGGGAWVTLMLIMLGLFGISFAAQGIDAAIVTERVENLPPYLQLTLYYILPSMATLLLFVIGIAHAVTSGNHTQASTVPKQPNAVIETMKRAGNDTMDAYTRLVNNIGRDVPKAKRAESPKVTPPTTPKAAGDSGETFRQ